MSPKTNNPNPAVPTPGVARAVAALRRRGFARQLATWSARGLLVGAGLAGVAIATDRLAGLGLAALAPWWAVPASGAGVGLLAGAAVAWRKRPGRMSAALAADEALGLRGRLGNALELRTRGAFARWVVDDAERVAQNVRPGAVYPVRFGRDWLLWPIALGIVTAGSALLPYAPWAAAVSPADLEQAALEVEAMREAEALVSEAVETARRESASGGSVLDFASPADLQALDELERELAAGAAGSPQEVRDEAASRLEQIADDADRAAERAERSRDAMRSRFGEEADFGAANELADRLSDGDLTGASEAAERLRELSRELPDDAREELADALERLASEPGGLSRELPDALDAAAEALGTSRDGAGELASDRDELADRLREAGLPETEAERLADRAADAADEQAAEDAAEDIAESLREEAERLREPEPEPEPEPESATESETEAPTVEPDAEPTPEGDGGPSSPDAPFNAPDAPTQGSQDPDSRRESGENGSSQDPNASGNNPQPGTGEPNDQQQSDRAPRGNEPGDEPSRESGDESGSGAAGESGSEPSPRQMTEPQPERGDEQPGSEEPASERPASEQTGAEETSAEETGAEQSGTDPGQAEESGSEQPGADEPGEAPSEQSGDQPGDRPGEPGTEGDTSSDDAASPGGQSGEEPGASPSPEQSGDARPGGAQPGEQQGGGNESGTGEGVGEPSDDPDAGEPLADRLRRMQDVADEADRARDASRRLRDTADELRGDRPPRPTASEPVSEPFPGQDRRADRAPARSTPTDLRSRPTETVDMRDPDAIASDERVIAEWLGEGGAEPGDAAAQRVVGERLREAAGRAERALEQQNVPASRRALIQRVFDRVQQRSAAPPPAPKPPARAKDAGDG